jgi:hypothetical protein
MSAVAADRSRVIRNDLEMFAISISLGAFGRDRKHLKPLEWEN